MVRNQRLLLRLVLESNQVQSFVVLYNPLAAQGYIASMPAAVAHLDTSASSMPVWPA